MNFFKKYWPFIFLLLITVIYSFPYLFQGKIPFPSSYIANNLAPWNRYLPHGPIKNGIPDVPGEIFPMRSLMIDFWKNGIIPLWNPYVFSGTPLLANFQSAVFSPLNLLFGIFSKADAWSILVLLQPLLAGVFVYLLGRSLRLSRLASLFSGISFMFCGYLTVWGSYTTMGYTILFLPLVLYWIERFWTSQNDEKDKKHILYLPLITITLAISFFSGHIQTWTYVFLATIIYSIIRIFWCHPELGSGSTKQMPKQVRHDNTGVLFLFIFLVIPLVAIQLLPTWEFYQLSGRVLVRNTSSGIGIPFQYLVTMLAPDFFGNPVTRNDWFGSYAEWSGYAGLIPLIFGLFSIVNISSFLRHSGERSDSRIDSGQARMTIGVIPIMAIAIAGFILSVRNPLLSFLSQLPIPILSNSNPTRAIVLLTFSISILSGFGLEQIIINWEKAKVKLLSILITVSIIFIIVLTIIFFGKNLFSPDFANSLRFISLRNLIFPTVIFVTVWILLVLTWRKPQWKKFTVYCLLFLATIEMLRFYVKWTPFDAKTSFYQETPITDFLEKQESYYRFYGQFNQTAGYINHLLATDGYEPLNLLAYSELLSGVPEGELVTDYQLEVKLQSQEKYTKKLLDILGAKYLVYGADDIRNPFVFPFWKYDVRNFPQIFTDGKYTVFSNKEIVKRPQLFAKYEVITNKEKALKTLLSDGFDYNNVLILASKPDLNETLGTGSAVMKKYGPNEIEMETEAKTPSLLFLSDNYFPGWQAYVNGEKTKILLADFTFRAVVVSAGKSMVVFRYEPESFKYGIIISGISVISLLVFVILNLFQDLKGMPKRVRHDN
ncbi:YfhO family protein [Candidatus Roizmanbacteria bacterium]|nr:YfhO family protein [Candidatus Roizmanbacteria bacterium]